MPKNDRGPVYFVYAGPHASGMPWNYCISSCGKEVTGCLTMLYKQDENGEGEVLNAQFDNIQLFV